jgi:hypothetical protein
MYSSASPRSRRRHTCGQTYIHYCRERIDPSSTWRKYGKRFLFQSPSQDQCQGCPFSSTFWRQMKQSSAHRVSSNAKNASQIKNQSRDVVAGVTKVKLFPCCYCCYCRCQARVRWPKAEPNGISGAANSECKIIETDVETRRACCCIVRSNVFVRRDLDAMRCGSYEEPSKLVAIR